MQASQYLSAKDIEPLDLTTVPVFKDLHIDNIESLLSVCQLKTFEPHDVIVKKGNIDPWMFILLEGKASVILDETEVTVIHTRGALFGETAIIDNSKRTADIIAQTHCKCLGIDSILMKEVLSTTNKIFYAHFYKHICKMLLSRLTATNDELALVKRAFNHIIETP